MHLSLRNTPSHPDRYAATAPAGTRTGWQVLILRAGRQPSSWIATLHVECGEAEWSRDIRLVRPLARVWGRLGGIKLGVFFLGGQPGRVSARLYNAPGTGGALGLTMLPVPFVVAAVGIWLQGPGTVREAFRRAPGGWTTRLRTALAAASIKGQQIDTDYNVWTWFFDRWTEARLQAIARDLPRHPTVAALVFSAGGAGPALEATLASLRAQAYPAAVTVVAGPGTVQKAAGHDYTAVLQAGEVLPRHALLVLVDEAVRSGADVLLADEDNVAPDGTRADPWFKPQPGLAMMCSGLLSRGVWLIRSSLLPLGPVPPWAASVQLAAWFALYEAGGAARARRVPRVLTHRRGDAEVPPPDVLAGVVDAGLARLGVRATVAPGLPLRLCWHPDPRAADRVSIIVPSRLHGEVQVRCLLDVLQRTAYPNFEMLVVVTQDAPLDEAQQEVARRLAAAGPARVEVLRATAFNYSLANNVGASLTQGRFLCLLNDDVSTLDGVGDWLDRMLAMFSDPRVGIVGAKLYYPDMTTQHGGVIMGLAGLAEHANRFLPRGEPGYMWRGVLDQEMSVVTGACLLVRRDVFDQVGGLDEALPRAFNDVDFCLRAGALGYSIMMAASVELVHHETLSFGHHYAGDAEREQADVALMRARWRAVCEADPFHNPNLSLVAGSEWSFASPPRLDLD